MESVEVVVVDNCSTDRTVEVAQRHGATVLAVEPGSVSRARNHGAAAAHGELLAFVDADCELDSNWLCTLVEILGDPGVVAAGSEIAPPGDPSPWVERTWYELAHAHHGGTTQRVAWLASFNLLVRKQAFFDCKGFDETLVTCEDVDLSHRLASRGALVRDASVRTRHHGESKTLGEFFRREAWRGRGSLGSLISSRCSWRELRSVLVPLGFTGLSLSGLAAMVWSLVTGQGAVGTVGLAMILGAACVPGLAVAQKLAPPWNCLRLAQAWLLLAAYLTARTVGLFRSVQRVSKR